MSYKDNPDRFSQWGNSPFGRVLGEAQLASSEYYREYVTEDWGMRTVGELTKVVALALIKSSPYYDRLSSFQKFLDVNGKLEGIMNKGAVRITEQAWVYNHDGNYYLMEAPDGK